MNTRMICRVLGWILLILAGLLLLPLLVGLIYREPVLHFLITAALAAAAGFLLTRIRPRTTAIYAREGFVIVGLGWILMSLLGALPFVLGGSIPHYIDALFETASGLSTTGATILTDVEALPRADMFWRLFTHWIGGMGVLVFLMAVLPMSGDHSMHIMRAEVPGPTVGKLVPRAKKTATILYLIYIGHEQIRRGGPGLPQGLGIGGAALHADHVQLVGNAADDIRIAVDDGDVMPLLGEKSGHCAAHLSRARDDDLHKKLPSAGPA